MGQTADKLALWLMDRIRDMAMTELGPIRTQLTNHHARFGDIEREMLTTDDQRAMSARVSKAEALLEHTRKEIGHDRMAAHEVEKEHAKAITEVEARVHALAKRVDLLESGRTGSPIEPYRPSHTALRHGPPPGVPDPTTAAIENITGERNEARAWCEQLKRERADLQAACERKNEQINGLTERATDAERVMRETVAGQVRVADKLRETIADQAKQIAELRETLTDDRSAHAAALHRKDTQRDIDFAEGSAQNRRLIEDNQRMREELHSTKARRDELHREKEAHDAQLKIICDERDKAQTEAKDSRLRSNEFALKVRALEEQAQRRGKLDDTRIERLAELEGKQGITRARAVSIAVEAAAADQIQTYTAVKPFVPHEWVVQAVMRAGGGEVADPQQPESDSCDCPSRPGTYDIAHVDGCPLACTCGALADGQEHKIGCPEMPF